MIRRYNRMQLIRAALLLLGSIVCCALAFLFFRYFPVFIAKRFGYSIPSLVAITIGLAGLAAAAFSGYQTWKKRGGLQGYHESAFYHDLGGDSAGAVLTDYYAHRITAPAHVLSQIFTAGPLFLLQAWTHISSQIPFSEDLEQRVKAMLTTLQAAKKWQSLDEYPNHVTEILYLAQMDLIDFSAHKGTPRFKAR